MIAPFFPLIDHHILVRSMGLTSPLTPGTRGRSSRGTFPSAGNHDEAGELEDFVPFSELMNTTIARKAVD